MILNIYIKIIIGKYCNTNDSHKKQEIIFVYVSNKPQNNQLEISKNNKNKYYEHNASVDTSFMIPLKINNVHNFKELLVEKMLHAKRV